MRTSPSRSAVVSFFATLLLASLGAAATPAGAAPGDSSLVLSPHCLDQGAWRRLPDAAVAREDHAAAYDSRRGRLIFFGGHDESDSMYTNQTWALALPSGQWRRLGQRGPSVPRGREGHSMIYDPRRDRLIVFGGFNEDNITQYRNDLWALSLVDSTWTLLRGDSCYGNGFARPECRWYHSAIYDPIGDRMIVYGGSYRSTMTSDVWAYALDGSNRWTKLVDKGAGPEATSHTAVYDSDRRRMIVFGGYDAQIGPASNDAWVLWLDGDPRWERLQPEGVRPSPRYDHVAVYDSPRRRMIVYGGWGLPPESPIYDEVWELSLGDVPRWTRLSPIGDRPEPRRDAVAVLDPVGERMLVYGGEADEEMGDTWSLELHDRTPPAAVSDLAVDVRSRTGLGLTWTAPGDDGVLGAACAYDIRYAIRPFAAGDFERAAVAEPAPIPAAAGTTEEGWIGGLEPCRRYYVALRALDDAGNRSPVSAMVEARTVCGPREGSSLPEAGSVPAAGTVFAGDARTRARLWFEVAPAARGQPYRATVLDVSGRRVRELGRGVVEGDRLELGWDGRDDQGATMVRGVYFVRLRIGESVVSRKVLRLD